ncbi:S8 family serine peptidase [bacterium]|nr:S8 family serine peptidase [bacterium]
MMIRSFKMIVTLWLLVLYNMIVSADIPGNLGPCLKRRLLEFDGDEGVKLNKTRDVLLDIRLCTEDPWALKCAGFKIRSVNGFYATATVPLSRINELARHSGVRWVKEASKCHLNLDQSMPEIGMDAIRSITRQTGYTGKNVIVGIIDTGIDWTHEDFIDDDGNTRILTIWDQTLDEYGGPLHIYTQAQIQAALDQEDGSSIGGTDVYGHGTHVAGIAAGNGRGRGNGKSDRNYVGGAPEAFLIVVKVSDGVSMTDSQVEDALNFIFQKAGEYDLPCVVNLSLGRRNGSHDGRSAFELGMNNYLTTAGRAIVVSAGNDGGKRIHIQHDFNPFIEDTLKVEVQVSDNDPASIDQVSFEGWIHRLAPVCVTIIDPQGERYGPIAPDALYRWPENGEIRIFVDNGSSGAYEYNGDKQILVQLMDGAQGDELSNGKWTIQFHDGSDRLDLWLVDRTLSAEITSTIDETTLLNEPAHALLVVAVGSYISRTQWPNLYSSSWKPDGLTLGALSATSSPGPSRSNSLDNHTRNKPEITAPGEYIVSTHSAFVNYCPGEQYIASDSVHRAWAGTSFAAPHITGLIACMFEADPNLTANAIKGCLLKTRKDDFTGEDIWNNAWGYGKVDAAAAMGISRVEHERKAVLPDHQYLIRNFPNPFNGCTTITVSLNDLNPVSSVKYLEIYNIHGQLIRSVALPDTREGMIQIQWDGRNDRYHELSSGVYFVRLRGYGGQCRLKNNIKLHSCKMILMR